MKEGARIRRIFILMCVIAASGTFCSSQVPTDRGMNSIQRKKHATISIKNTVHHFGKIVQGEKPVATFVFRNTGDDVLNIGQVAADNKNITTEVSHKSVNPGEQGSIKVTLDSTRLHGGVVSRIIVITNDEKHHEVFLTVVGQVQPMLALNPPFIFIGQVAKEGSFSGKAKLVGKLVDEDKLESLTINKSSPAIEATIRQRGGRNPMLEFVLRPEQKAGTFRENITLVSEEPPAQAQLLLLGQKLGDIRVTPDKLDFFPRKGVKPDSRSILFECDKPFNITKVEDPGGLLNVTINIIEEWRKYELTARLKSPMGGSFLGVVKVYTDLKEHPLIHIPVIGGKN